MSSQLFVDAAVHRKRALVELRHMAETASVEDDAQFVSVLKLSAQVLELSEGEIADALRVSRPTVNRWLNEQSDPHPAMRQPIFGWIATQVKRRLRTLEQGPRADRASSRSNERSRAAGR